MESSCSVGEEGDNSTSDILLFILLQSTLLQLSPFDISIIGTSTQVDFKFSLESFSVNVFDFESFLLFSMSMIFFMFPLGLGVLSKFESPPLLSRSPILSLEGVVSLLEHVVSVHWPSHPKHTSFKFLSQLTVLSLVNSMSIPRWSSVGLPSSLRAVAGPKKSKVEDETLDLSTWRKCTGFDCSSSWSLSFVGLFTGDVMEVEIAPLLLLRRCRFFPRLILVGEGWTWVGLTTLGFGFKELESPLFSGL